jgi:hypothetical protein
MNNLSYDPIVFNTLKVMEKFDGANFHLWKFKMCTMLSKHGLWKFVDGSATIPEDQDQITDYNEKATKAFALLCEHLTDAQLAHIQYCKNVKSVWETRCGVHKAKTIGNKLFLRRRFLTIKMQEGEDLLAHINMVKALADQLRSIKVKIEDEDVYMVLFISFPPSFDNLVTSFESMSTKDVDLQLIVARLLHGLCFYCKKPGHFVRNCLKKNSDEKEKASQTCEDHE